ncbi:MAG TPA: GPW/gp25 family protein [Bryobacteraceae bacterium]|nr:GPW/gp25 family protein [Bryobacteraceae bacterium]
MAQIQTDPNSPRFMKYPYTVGGSGIPATTTADDHIRDLILQTLFTNPGERVNLPGFGVGVERLVFEPSGDTLLATAQFLITTNLRQWLGDRIDVQQVTVTTIPGEEYNVTIEITYVKKATQQQQQLVVQV